jgi:hypothetical protein
MARDCSTFPNIKVNIIFIMRLKKRPSGMADWMGLMDEADEKDPP